MVELLQASPEVAEGLERLVLQPMSGVEELRQWLYENGYHVREDRLTAVGRRWYQVLCVRKGTGPDPWPEGFPRGCWLVGYQSFQDRDERLGLYCREQLNKRKEQLKRAVGTAGEDRLSREARQLSEIIEEIRKWT